MLLSNAFMISFFLKAMHTSGSLVATVMSSASNFLMSGILGRLIFKERISRVWWLGAVCIYGGIILLASASTTSNSKKNKKQD
mmetsp:Transcript_15996/g.20042  ORF Transcript_15996/g.20042 Transcript_15996/m.20042 type:complete len:83 (-) Transcript_15996:238-486(-)